MLRKRGGKYENDSLHQTDTQLEEPESRPVAEEEQQLTGVEMEESLQATPTAPGAFL